MRKIFDKWKINRNLFSQKIGISKGSFNNKIGKNKTINFNTDELLKIKKVLIDFKIDLENLIKKL